VGNTGDWRSHLLYAAVHPHACGEYFTVSVYLYDHNGPSPRVWRIPCKAAWLCGPARSIPTRVGNTASTSGSLTRAAVHPHACGEYDGWREMARDITGPSPRVWGIRHVISYSSMGLRSIPTRVGNTLFSPHCAPYVPVHPHACGEYGMTGGIRG